MNPRHFWLYPNDYDIRIAILNDILVINFQDRHDGAYGTEVIGNLQEQEQDEGN